MYGRANYFSIRDPPCYIVQSTGISYYCISILLSRLDVLWMIFGLLHSALKLKSTSFSPSCKNKRFQHFPPYIISNGTGRKNKKKVKPSLSEILYPANDIVECAGKLVEASWHSPTEKSKPILVAQHAFIIEPDCISY